MRATRRRADPAAMYLMLAAGLLLAVFWGKPGVMLLVIMMILVALAIQVVKA